MKTEIYKTVYFVRHGESEDNTKAVFQSTESPLSEKGREQALKIAERASKLDFQTLISSPYLRAKETAGVISKATGKEPEYSDLFTERVKPSSINGKPHDNMEAKATSLKWYESLFSKGIRIEDGENYEDLIARADKVLDFLKNHTEKNLFVVTHGFFLRVLLLRVVLGSSITEGNLRNFQESAAMKNTGLSVLEYSSWHDEPPKWRLWVYNDHSHLG